MSTRSPRRLLRPHSGILLPRNKNLFQDSALQNAPYGMEVSVQCGFLQSIRLAVTSQQSAKWSPYEPRTPLARQLRDGVAYGFIERARGIGNLPKYAASDLGIFWGHDKACGIAFDVDGFFMWGRHIDVSELPDDKWPPVVTFDLTMSRQDYRRSASKADVTCCFDEDMTISLPVFVRQVIEKFIVRYQARQDTL